MEETEGSIDLRQYWLIVRRRWLPATLVTLGTIGLTVGVTALQTPIYQPEGLVLLKKDSGLTPSSSLDSASGSTAGVLESLTSQSNPASTEIAIITSDPLLLKTIRALNLRWQPSILQTLRIMPSPPTDELRPVDFLKNLTVTNVKDTDVISIQYKNADPKLATKVVNTLMSFYKARNLESNREEATAARKFVETQLPKAEQDVRRYAEALRIFKERSKVVSIPAEQQGAVTALGTLQTSLTDLQGKLAEANTRSQSLRNQVGLSPKQALQVNALSQSPAVQKALTDLQDVQRLLATARTQFQSNHPQIRDLEERQTALSSFLGTQVNQVIGLSTSASSPTQLNTVQAGQTQQSLSESLAQAEVQRMGLQNQVDSLSKSRLEYLQNMSKLPRLEEIDRDLERQLGVATETYQALLKSWQQFRISENQNVGNVDVVQAATIPDMPVSPIWLMNILIGVILGLLLGIGTALILEALDTTVKSVKEAEEIFDLTVLGTIPQLEGSAKVSLKNLDRATPKLSVRDDPRSAISEAYRMLQANIRFLSSDNPPRVIVMTSSVPQEGKSTTTANLALVFAELGHRVLVVDADLRRPSQHQIWELPNSVGLSNILVEPGKWAGVVRSENEFLDIITAGIIPPNPVRLLDSHRMANLIGEWREVYDYVIIDTPPLAVASDALLVAQMTDGLLMVARPGVLTTPSADTSKAALAKASGDVHHGAKRATLLGLVVNGVIPENEPDSYYYFHAKDYYAMQPDDSLGGLNGKIPSERSTNLEPSSSSSPKQ